LQTMFALIYRKILIAWSARMYLALCPSELTCRRQTLSTEDQDDLNDLQRLFNSLASGTRPSEGISYMRAPLHLALLISPVYLLLPIQHVKKSYNRHTMLSISTCLGNSKPQMLIDVEKAIWRTVFDLASGENDPFDLLHGLTADLPWDSIRAASPVDSAWFDLCKFDF
jgi:hypothetical protein